MPALEKMATTIVEKKIAFGWTTTQLTQLFQFFENEINSNKETCDDFEHVPLTDTD